jgi:hypothetical protein
MVDLLITPSGGKPKVEELIAFLSVDENGKEGFISTRVPGLFGHVPLVCSKPNVADMMEKLAQEAVTPNKTYRRVVFRRVEG